MEVLFNLTNETKIAKKNTQFNLNENSAMH